MKPFIKTALLSSVMALGLMGASQSALAQNVDPVKLLDLMVQKGLVTAEEAAALKAEATTQPVQPVQPAIPAGGVRDGVQTIPYIPQVVREQIKAELKSELGTQAQTQGWSKPGETPEWTRRITLSGDIRVRGNGLFFDEGNADIFENFRAINAGPGQNINDKTPDFIGPEYLNTRENRAQFQVRARMGVQAEIADWITAELSVATGIDNSPVSTNQTLGAGAESGKYQLWLDRAAIRLKPTETVAIDLGRFANPFWTADMLFDEDMNFDGVAVSAKAGGLFGTIGAFPLYNTSLNFGSRNAPTGTGGPHKSQDKYLAAVQIGADYALSDSFRLKGALGYFHFDGVQGQVSSPCYWYETVCDTDVTRPAFQQYGNTMFPIRNVIADPQDPVGSPEVQYFGLASKFEVLNARLQAEMAFAGGYAARVEADYVKNLGFDRELLRARAVNNLGPSTQIPDPNDSTKTLTVPGIYDGGDEGWSVRASIGKLTLRQRGDWNAHIGYQHLESDAVVDAFTESDFHIGGTNVKGWFIGGNYGLSERSYLGVRWRSAEEIADAPFSVDRLLIDLGVKF